jgi:xanthine/CO dehydrogenase XdhC/CoxF family maturation factor/CTP:molybdopterin cytidylyltransferase MocA
MNKIYKYLLDQPEKNIPLAIATIVKTKGSTPQVQGTSAIISKEGLMQGTLGGGILEADAQKRASVAIQEKDSQLYEFDLDADLNSNDTAPCGGKAVILIDANPKKSLNVFRDIEKSLGNRRPGVLATFIGRLKNEKAEIKRYWIEKHVMNLTGLYPELAGYENLVQKCMNEKETIYLPVDNILYFENVSEILLFLEPILPVPMLIIAGAGHVGQAVAQLGSLLDFEITVIDDRPEYCNNKKIPDADHYIVGDIGKAIQNISKTPDTYIVIVTRDHRNDADALKECITSEAAYIGMMGSKRKVRLTREKILEEGLAVPSQFDRVHAPIGLEIGSQTVHEIAVSICAQLIMVRRQKQKKKKKAVISCIILAAGKSSRMGQPKLLLPYGETTIIDTVIREAIRSEANHIIIVLGSEKDNISEHIRDYPLIITENREFHLGMLSSVQCGFRALPENTDAVLILLGDQPMIPASVINDVINAYRQTEKGIVIAAHNGKRGHPILFDIKYKQEVEQLDSDHSLHNLTRKYPDDIYETEVDTPVILRDIDTIDDYNKELKYRRLT